MKTKSVTLQRVKETSVLEKSEGDPRLTEKLSVSYENVSVNPQTVSRILPGEGDTCWVVFSDGEKMKVLGGTAIIESKLFEKEEKVKEVLKG